MYENISQEKQLTALVPVYQFPNAELIFGLTTNSHPTFWFYSFSATLH
ncbi:DUF928 domain-containing protein [Nostoc commune]|nr:DUF928 domain-containing protein [Nostoc commune]